MISLARTSSHPFITLALCHGIDKLDMMREEAHDSSPAGGFLFIPLRKR